MCAILGQISIKGEFRSDRRAFDDALDLMSHRGPDDRGVHEGRGFLFGHRRLSILDPDPRSRQPFRSPDGKVSLIFNGELYNFLELRTELAGRGHVFSTQSDTEVLLAGYLDKGIEFLHKLNGMFAFAIYDQRTSEAWLVRDRMGIKPLFYCRREDRLTFASEIKAILAYEQVPRQVNPFALSSYFSYRYPIQEHTFFKDVSSLLPGTYLHIRDGRVSERCYWNLADHLGQEADRGEAFYLNQVEQHLERAVQLRMRSDVPYGAFLSGGVDSSAITAMMARHSVNPVKTFTIGFQESGYDEFAFADLVAARHGCEHRQIQVDGSTYLDSMVRLIGFKDAPLAVPNEVPLYLMSQALKKHITVVLSGEGADEIFCGYGRIFRSPYDYNRMRSWANGESARAGPFYDAFLKRYGRDTFDDTLSHFLHLYNYTSLQEKSELLHPDLNLEVLECDLISRFRPCFEGVADETTAIMHSFQRIHLPGLLNRLDATTMAASVEGRVPFVDHELVTMAMAIPQNHKLRWTSQRDMDAARNLTANQISEVHDTPKYILKKAMEPLLPEQVLYRPKMGFPVPLHAWLGGSWYDYAHDLLLSQKARQRGLYQTDSIRTWLKSDRLKQDHSFAMKIWMLLNLEHFFIKYFD